MLGEPENQISERAMTVWRIQGLILSFIFLIPVIIFSVFSYFFHWPVWMIALLFVLWLAGLWFFVIFSPKLRWKIWRYEVREQEIEIQHGLWIIKKTLIPMIRVQHVDHTQGPLLKKYQLATVQISTAATTHEIPALDEQEAEELRRLISGLARVADEDV